LIVIFCFSLVKAVVNAPRLCKLCKDCLIAIGNGAIIVFAAALKYVYKTPPILHFFIVQGGARTNARLQLWSG
jgi:hypothetical protein